MIGLLEFDLGGLDLCSYTPERCAAIVDSGTSFIGIPERMMEAVLEIVTKGYTCRRGAADEFTVCDCSEGIDDFPVLKLWVSSVSGTPLQVTLNPVDYLVIVEDTNHLFCMPGFMPLADGEFNFIILGDTFLRTYYTVFDSERQVIHVSVSSAPPITFKLPDRWFVRVGRALAVGVGVGAAFLLLAIAWRSFASRRRQQAYMDVEAHTTVIENGIDEQEGLVWSATSASAPQSTEAKTLSSMNRTA